MSYHQYIIDHSVWVNGKVVEELVKTIKADISYTISGRDPDEMLSDIAAQYNFGLTWSDSGDVDGIELLDTRLCADQMEFIGALAKHIRPDSFITLINEDHGIWQWYFNHGKVYTREVVLPGIVTAEEDEDRKKLNLPEKSGYRYCHCRDCLHEIVGVPDQFCWECESAGCPHYQGVEGMSQECQRPDAYAHPDCPTCDKSDEVYYTGSDWKCERCRHEEVFNKVMTGFIQVKMYPNGAAVVRTGESSCPWPKEMVQRAEESSKSCCESRGVNYPIGAEHCACLACNVDKARRKSREDTTDSELRVGG